MSEMEVVDASTTDPFAPENIGVIQFITAARIYDVLMSLLAATNEEAADRLLKVHAQGGLVGPEPRFNGVFVADTQTTGESD